MGLAAAVLGAEVTLTDREETLSLLERNTRSFVAEHCSDAPPWPHSSAVQVSEAEKGQEVQKHAGAWPQFVTVCKG